jgi:hypothetical protein
MNEPATKGSKKRPIKRQIIVLTDGAGNYYELPRAALERSRVNERRKKEVAAALKNVPSCFGWIRNSTIPGSIATAPFKGGRALHYAGFYLSSAKSKR